MQGVQPFCVYVSVEAASYSCLPKQKQIDAKDNGCYQGMVTSLQIRGNDVSCVW